MKKMLFISMITCFLTCTEVQASIANPTSSTSQFNQISTNLVSISSKKFIRELYTINGVNLGKMMIFLLIMI